jgi:hypothetical protein
MACTIEFLPRGGAVIEADIAKPTATDEACFRLCINAVSLYAPRSFRSQISYSSEPKSIHVEVTIAGNLLQSIPLLADICSATDAESDTPNSSSANRTKSKLGSSVSAWGLISLFMIHEEVVSIDGFLGGPDCHVDLPRQTLEV